MKFYIFSFLLIFSVFSCKEEVDLCENVVCNNDGVCNDGTCDCPPEFMGTNCDELAPASAVRITKVIITDWSENNDLNETWDEDGNPDLFVTLNTTNFTEELTRTEINENAEYGTEQEFIVDWLVERSESNEGNVIWTDFVLWDNDDSETIEFTSQYMGERTIFISNSRDEKPATIELESNSSLSPGIRIELEWIFE